MLGVIIMVLPFDPNDRTLLSSVFISADEDAYRQAKDVLDILRLPNPEEGEFFSGANADRIYLNTHGLIFSFVYRRPTLGGVLSSLFGRLSTPASPVFHARTIVDERILQPLYQVDLSPRCCLEIIPGVEHVGTDLETVKSIAQELKEKKIKFDPQREFVGVVRTPDDEEDLVVVTNRRAIRTADADAGSGDAGRQDKTYRSLREQMHSAFTAANGTGVENAMAECARIVALNTQDPARILNPHWKSPGIDSERSHSIRKAAKNFHQRLSQ